MKSLTPKKSVKKENQENKQKVAQCCAKNSKSIAGCHD